MRRNLRGEITTAAVVIVVLVGAVVIAALLSTTATEPTPTVTAVANITVVADGQATATPSQAPSPTFTLIVIQMPTATPTIPTPTPLPPTATFTPSVTATATFTPSATVTDTTGSLPPAVMVPTATLTATFTPQPTATLTSTASPTTTDTPTFTPTATFTPEPTATDTATFTPEPTATDTPTFTPEPTATDTPTFTPLPTLEGDILLPPTPNVPPTLTPTACDQPPGWSAYVTQSGDTLLGIARAAETTLADLRNANCIGEGDFVAAGRVLFVPRPIAGPVVFTPTDDVFSGGVIGCTNANVSIQMIPDSLQDEVFPLVGSAIVSNFWYYEVSVRPNGSDEFSLYKTSFTPVINDVLAQINTTFFGSGRHWVRLEAFDLSGTVPFDASCEVLFQFP